MNPIPDEEPASLMNFERLAVGGALPIVRSGQRTFADENYFYLVGGYNPSPERTLTDAWRFNRLTQEWQQCTLVDPNSPLPDTLASFSLVARGPPPECSYGSNEAFIFGGTKVPFGGASNSNRLYWIKIDRGGQVHVKLQSVSGNEPLPHIYGQGMCRRLEKNARGRLREVLYIVGGTTGHEYNMDVWRLERPYSASLTEPWELTRLNRHNPDEFGRYRLELVPYDDKLFTFGGSISDQFFVQFEELTVFDLKLNQFEKLPTKADRRHGYPRERSCHALVHVGNMVYLLGGRDMEMNIFANIWRFDMDNLQWTELNCSLPVPIFFHSSAFTPDGCILVFGGVTIDGNQNRRVNDLQCMWIEPPSLRYFASMELLRLAPDELHMQLTAHGVRLGDPMLLILCCLEPGLMMEKLLKMRTRQQEESLLLLSPPPPVPIPDNNNNNINFFRYWTSILSTLKQSWFFHHLILNPLLYLYSLLSTPTPLKWMHLLAVVLWCCWPFYRYSGQLTIVLSALLNLLYMLLLFVYQLFFG